MVITLPPQLEAALSEQARRRGVAPEALALDTLRDWDRYYNYARAHSALQYLRPYDYYRGDPQARLQERADKLARAEEARRTYWQQHSGDIH